MEIEREAHGVPASRKSLLPNPKLTLSEKRSAIYPYYPGFSSTFVRAALEKMDARQGAMVMDPWNGSGTTTLNAAILGARSIGCDLNPALNFVARGRIACRSEIDQAKKVWCSINKSVPRKKISSIDACAKLYERVSVSNEMTPQSKALIMCALFSVVRKYATSAKTSNPTWFSLSQSPPLVFDEIADAADSEVVLLTERAAKLASSRPKFLPDIKTSSFLDLEIQPRTIDIILTSPPYLTRLDYVRSTLPELQLLSLIEKIDMMQLRNMMMGSPIVGSVAPALNISWGKRTASIMELVTGHPSKASSTYYARFFLKYFENLWRALNLIKLWLKPGGKACIVVQSSYYKEHFIDLQAVVQDMAERCDLYLLERHDFKCSRSIVEINSRALGNVKTNVESAVFLQSRGNR